MGRDRKLPDPGRFKSGDPAVYCSAERVLGLYNQDSGDTAQRVVKKMRRWFAEQAHGAGWSGVHFMPEVEPGQGAGCVLWRPLQQVNLHVVVTQQTLILQDQSDGGDTPDAESDAAVDPPRAAGH